jgi:hypothetical protein
MSGTQGDSHRSGPVGPPVGSAASAVGPSGRTTAAASPPGFDGVVLDLEGTLVDSTRGCLPGARELLTDLRRAGYRVAIASLAGRRFVEEVLALLGESGPDGSRVVEAVRCLDSPGCEDKAAMLEDLALSMGTRSLLMVGDSGGDGLAAAEAGLPFVHYRGSGAPSLGEDHAEIQVLDELIELMAERPRRLLSLWSGLARPLHLALVGAGGSGVDLLARDLARAIEHASGRPPLLVHRWEERDSGVLAETVSTGELVIAHGAAAAQGWPAGAEPRVVEVRAVPRLVAARLRAAHRPFGPQAVREALGRETQERLWVAQAVSERLPEAWIDGGDVLFLGARDRR